jgi:hypothetical protein
MYTLQLCYNWHFLFRGPLIVFLVGHLFFVDQPTCIVNFIRGPLICGQPNHRPSHPRFTGSFHYNSWFGFGWRFVGSTQSYIHLLTFKPFRQYWYVPITLNSVACTESQYWYVPIALNSLAYTDKKKTQWLVSAHIFLKRDNEPPYISEDPLIARPRLSEWPLDF